MKKFGWLILVLSLLLTGCAAAPTFETLGGDLGAQEIPQPRQCSVSLPEAAAVQTAQGDTGTIYFCDGYEILVETMAGGNLSSTVKNISGYDLGELTLVETKGKDYACYECAWTSAGEGGFQTARTKILDDGVYHYCLTVLAPAEEMAGLQEELQQLFGSFTLT